MTMEELKTAVLLCIQDLEERDAREIWNEYSNRAHNGEGYIWRMEEFDVEMQYEKPSKIADMVSTAWRFWPNDNYFYFDEVGCLGSCEKITDVGSPYDQNELTNHIVKTRNDFGITELREILNG